MSSGELPVIRNALGMENVRVVQAVSVKNPGNTEEFRFVAVVEISNGKFQLAGLTSLGQRIFTVTADGESLEIEKAAWLPDHIQIEKLLLMLQFVYWPENALSNAYREKWHIDLKDDVKRLYRGKVLVIEAFIHEFTPSWGDSVELHQVSSGMHVFINPVEVEYL